MFLYIQEVGIEKQFPGTGTGTDTDTDTGTGTNTDTGKVAKAKSKSKYKYKDINRVGIHPHGESKVAITSWEVQHTLTRVAVEAALRKQDYMRESRRTAPMLQSHVVPVLQESKKTTADEKTGKLSGKAGEGGKGGKAGKAGEGGKGGAAGASKLFEFHLSSAAVGCPAYFDRAYNFVKISSDLQGAALYQPYFRRDSSIHSGRGLVLEFSGTGEGRLFALLGVGPR
jgi:hypothetical protein